MVKLGPQGPVGNPALSAVRCKKIRFPGCILGTELLVLR